MRNRPFFQSEIEEPGRVLLDHHEGATVCTLEQPVSGELTELDAVVLNFIDSLSGWILEQGGLVGHIKGSLKTHRGTVLYSNTGNGTSVRSYPETGGILKLTVIVFFVDDEWLKEQLEQFLEQL